MRNLAAFAPATSVPPVYPEAPSSAEFSSQVLLDQDGLAIPTFWQGNTAKWSALAIEVRRKQSALHLEEVERKAAKKPKVKRQSVPAKRFTTDYAVRWGQRQKKVDGTNRPWVLIDRERYDFKNKRHHDLMLGVDVIFDDGGLGMVGLQGAGRNERAIHHQRFLDRGGPEKAKRRGVRIYYLEFERGQTEPVNQERWA